MAHDQKWAVIVHGGCRKIAPEKVAHNRQGCEAACAQATRILCIGGSALDAAHAAVRELEQNPVFNAGNGAVRNANGNIETDAAIMEGADLRIGAVAAVPGLLNAVSVARALLTTSLQTLLVGEGARSFALEHGGDFGPAGPSHADSGDTVGCVALDQNGLVAAAVSTGGLSGKPKGRVGDSPLPGCGFYADNKAGGVSLSGDGEQISRTILAARAMVQLEADADAQCAVDRALSFLGRIGGEAGMIAIDRHGRIGWNHTGAEFAVAWANATDPHPQSAVSRQAIDG